MVALISAAGTQVLRLFSLSVLPCSINLLYFSLARIEKMVKKSSFVCVAMAVLTILSGYLLLRILASLAPALVVICSNRHAVLYCAQTCCSG